MFTNAVASAARHAWSHTIISKLFHSPFLSLLLVGGARNQEKPQMVYRGHMLVLLLKVFDSSSYCLACSGLPERHLPFIYLSDRSSLKYRT